MLPVTDTEVPTGAMFGESGSLSGVSPYGAEASTFDWPNGKTLTKYPAGATSGAVNVVERPPLVSVVVV